MMSLMMKILAPHVSKCLEAVKFTEPNLVSCTYQYFKLRNTVVVCIMKEIPPHLLIQTVTGLVYDSVWTGRTF